MPWFPRLDDIKEWLEIDRWRTLQKYLEQVLFLGGKTGGQAVVPTSGTDADGWLGVGVAPPLAKLHVGGSQNASNEVRISNPNAGVSANVRLRLMSEVASLIAGSDSSTSTAVLAGITLASWSFAVTTAGEGLLLGTVNNKPLVFMQNNVERLRLSGAALMFSATAGIFWGTGTPEGVVTAGIGSVFHRTNGGAGTSIYVKESGAGNTGWVAK